MSLIGMDSDEQMLVWRILAGILHLGNIAFVEEDSSDDDAAQIVDLDTLEAAAELLQVRIHGDRRERGNVFHRYQPSPYMDESI